VNNLQQICDCLVCPCDNDLNDAIRGLMGWYIAPGNYSPELEVGEWRCTVPKSVTLNGYIRCERKEMPNYIKGPEAHFNVWRAEQELILGWKEIDDYLKKLYEVSQLPHICQTSHAWAYVRATPKERTIAILMLKRPDIFRKATNDVG
jgi:hypothetical protein